MTLSTKTEWPPPPSVSRRVSVHAVHLLSPNAGAWTYEGTNTWLLGGDAGEDCIVVDPGSADPVHLEAIVQSAKERDWRIMAVVLTHDHDDHSDGARLLADRMGVKVGGFSDRHADWLLSDGDIIRVGSTRVEVLHTPGHSDDSISLLLAADDILLTGDTILGGRSSGVFGRLSEFLDSLQRLRGLAQERSMRLLPGHGPLVNDPQRVIDRVTQVRLSRVDEIAQHIADGEHDALALIHSLYPTLDSVRLGSAAVTVLSALGYLDQPANKRPTVDDDVLKSLILQLNNLWRSLS